MYYATEKQMEKLDILAVENGLEIRQMMELAGFHILHIFKELKLTPKSKVCVVVGKGNKGGDGLCASRHLINSGYQVKIVLISQKISPDASHQLELLKKMKADIILYSKNKSKAQEIMSDSNILIDALIGYHLQGTPRGLFRELIELMNQSGKRTIAYDIPSGMESTTGKCFDPCIKAFATLTLALPKRAFQRAEAKKYCGKIFLGDIGIPEYLYDKIAKGIRPKFTLNENLLIKI